MTGQTVSHYKILERLGRGGMGEVYKAEDTRLGRSVAVKFLSTELCRDRQALERFQREARMASALNHPNICTVYDIGEHEGRPFLVMELLSGQTLKERLAGCPLPAPELLEVMRQITDALEAAHRHGMVHRDIKPANLFVTERGQMKVLDFGLAKPAPTVAADASTLTDVLLSSPGAVLGTVAYMSPEQARGGTADARSDLFSLGVVLYEMATGVLPFRGPTAAVVFEAILNRAPELPGVLVPELPPGLEQVILKALQKDPNARYQSVGEMRGALETVRAVAAAPRRVRFGRWAAIAAAALGLAGLYLAREKKPTPASRSEWVQLTHFPDTAGQPALSADGRMLAFIRGGPTFLTRGQVYVKLLPEGEPIQLTRDNQLKMGPAFWPDGSRVAYTVRPRDSDWDTWVVPVLGGEPRLWLPNASGLVWLDRDRLLFSEIKKSPHMAIVTAKENRTEARDVYVPPTETGMAHKSWLSPNGQWVLLAEMDSGGWSPCRLVPFDGSSRGRQVGPPAGRCLDAAWTPDGQWMYFSSDSGGAFHIWRQRFPAGRVEQVTSGPTEEEGIAMEPGGRSFITAVGILQSSLLVGDAAGERQVSGEGFTMLPGYGDGWPRSIFSPEGSKVYYLLRRGGVGRGFAAGELWSADLRAGRNEQALAGFIMSSYDISPDGRKVVFAAADAPGKSRIWVARLDKRYPPRQLPPQDARGPVFGPGGKIYYRGAEGSASYIYRIGEDGEIPEKFVTDPMVFGPTVSPDEEWLVATMLTPGQEVTTAVKAYPVRGGPSQVICDYCMVAWSRDGGAFHLRFVGMGGDKTFVIRVKPGQALPKLPAGGIRSEADLAGLPVIRVIPRVDLFPGPNPDTYAYAGETAQRNLYRILIP